MTCSVCSVEIDAGAAYAYRNRCEGCWERAVRQRRDDGYVLDTKTRTPDGLCKWVKR